MNKVIYVSCYTDVYKEEAKGLIETLSRFNLPHEVKELPDLGSWDRNTKLKATYVQDMLKKNPGNCIVWLDADARVRKNPVLFNTLECDIACHIRRGAELLSGTVFFNNNQIVQELVDRWVYINKKKERIFDQRNLHEAIKEFQKQDKIKLENLPAPYCMFDLIQKHDNPIGEPVIWHRQASRKLRALVNHKNKKKRN